MAPCGPPSARRAPHQRTRPSRRSGADTDARARLWVCGTFAGERVLGLDGTGVCCVGGTNPNGPRRPGVALEGHCSGRESPRSCAPGWRRAPMVEPWFLAGVRLDWQSGALQAVELHWRQWPERCREPCRGALWLANGLQASHRQASHRAGALDNAVATTLWRTARGQVPRPPDAGGRQAHGGLVDRRPGRSADKNLPTRPRSSYSSSKQQQQQASEGGPAASSGEGPTWRALGRWAFPLGLRSRPRGGWIVDLRCAEHGRSTGFRERCNEGLQVLL
jgi:hypothetical protein